jgi:hypothetical protein
VRQERRSRITPSLTDNHPLTAHRAVEQLVRHAFTQSECDDIVALFRTHVEAETDVRENPLLPGQEGTGFGVHRTNRFDDGSLFRDGHFEATHRRLNEVLHPWLAAQASPFNLSASVDFHLLHEFVPGGHFDWHVDTKPGDGTRRTYNLNVMLSQPGVDFEGGALQVGAQVVEAQQGDAYVYSAAMPHRVSALDSGRRFTLVIALTEEPMMASDRQDSSQSDHNVGAHAALAQRHAWWQQTETQLAALLDGALSGESKVHILHGEFLEAIGRADEAKTAYCRSFRADGKPVAYAQKFLQLGLEALQVVCALRVARFATIATPHSNDVLPLPCHRRMAQSSKRLKPTLKWLPALTPGMRRLLRRLPLCKPLLPSLKASNMPSNHQVMRPSIDTN